MSNHLMSTLHSWKVEWIVPQWKTIWYWIQNYLSSSLYKHYQQYCLPEYGSDVLIYIHTNSLPCDFKWRWGQVWPKHWNTGEFRPWLVLRTTDYKNGVYHLFLYRTIFDSAKPSPRNHWKGHNKKAVISNISLLQQKLGLSHCYFFTTIKLM